MGLNPDQIKQLLNLPQRTRSSSGGARRTTPGTTRSVKIDHNDRSWPMWWRLDQTLSNCECEFHDEAESKRTRMCALVDDKYICRYCYVNRRDL